MLGGVNHKKARIFKQFLRRLEWLFQKKAPRSWDTAADAAARGHEVPDKPHLPRTHFPYDSSMQANSLKQKAIVVVLFYVGLKYPKYKNTTNFSIVVFYYF